MNKFSEGDRVYAEFRDANGMPYKTTGFIRECLAYGGNNRYSILPTGFETLLCYAEEVDIRVQGATPDILL